MNLVVPNAFEPNYTIGFAKGLAANGVKFVVLSSDETAVRLNAAGIENINVRGSMSEDRSALTKVMQVMSYYLRSAAILLRHRNHTVHFTGVLHNRRILMDALFLHLCARLSARRYLYTVHNVLPHGLDGSRIYRALYRLFYRVPHLLLVHTKVVRRQLMEEFGVPEAKIRLTSIGLNEEVPLTDLTREEARERLGFGAADKVILFFGKIDHYKGLDILLEAFDSLDLEHSRLVIAGSFGTQRYRDRIMPVLEAAARRRDIQLHEKFIPNDEVEIFFKAADVLCLPYRRIYQSGLVFLAPRFGLPMVSSAAGALREFVGESGIVAASDDAGGIRDALREFFATQELFEREEIARRARKYAWENICREIATLYSAEETCALKPELVS